MAWGYCPRSWSQRGPMPTRIKVLGAGTTGHGASNDETTALRERLEIP